jgi:hypothetical protein
VIHVVDVVGAYLNGTLEEIIFMMQPLEYDDGRGHVCQLLKLQPETGGTCME